MKLYVVGLMYSATIVVPDDVGDEEARAIVEAAVHDGQLSPHDAFAFEPQHERDLLAQQRGEPPFLHERIADEAVVGTALDVFKRLQQKRP